MALEDTIYYKRAVKALTDAEARGRAKGRVEGKAEGEARGARTALIRVISQHMGARLALPGPEALARMEASSLEALEKLALDMFNFQSHNDLTTWLEQQS